MLCGVCLCVHKEVGSLNQFLQRDHKSESEHDNGTAKLFFNKWYVCALSWPYWYWQIAFNLSVQLSNVWLICFRLFSSESEIKLKNSPCCCWFSSICPLHWQKLRIKWKNKFTWATRQYETSIVAGARVYMASKAEVILAIPNTLPSNFGFFQHISHTSRN